ncbi:hypothetical protein TNCV_4897041 [Trichonephila clavipes]|uniref:Uncharacterized protein n=1 Tax=Trichonephila clavipes TaxID=2585209 RepID=A0A8X6VWU7_TRICX|nr:hypothetical protein TNCV_4897041 [Trichonephila clavipes]
MALDNNPAGGKIITCRPFVWRSTRTPENVIVEDTVQIPKVSHGLPCYGTIFFKGMSDSLPSSPSASLSSKETRSNSLWGIETYQEFCPGMRSLVATPPTFKFPKYDC